MKTDFPITENEPLRLAAVSRSAFISECGHYRYILSRVWDASKPSVTFLMLNPSTADANVDDPTVRRCIRFAHAWGFGHIDIVNLFAYRSSNPLDLLKCTNPIGEHNALSLYTAALTGKFTVCAWGNSSIVNKLIKKFPDYKPLKKIENLRYLELSIDGTPKHPLYLRGDLLPKEYEITTPRLL